MVEKRKERKILTLAQKIQIIKQIETRAMTQKEVANLYGVDQSVISRILKKKTEILEAGKTNKDAKNLKGGKFLLLEDLTVKYIKLLRSNNFPVTKDVILESAIKIARDLNIENFKASNGWFGNFKKRNDWKSYVECGEENFVDKEKIAIWCENNVSDVLCRYAKDDIYNADETGFFMKFCRLNLMILMEAKGNRRMIAKSELLYFFVVI